MSNSRFSPADTTVIFVLGGPGSGKGTQCASLVSDYGFIHLSAGDLLRSEQERPGSEYGDLIRDYIKEGKIVPSHVTIALLSNAMAEHNQGKAKFLVDGFPRQMDQAKMFDDDICENKFVLFLTCTEDIMLERILDRGKTSGRADDNVESIKKRFRTFVETSMPVVDYYRSKGKVVEVDSTKSKEQVYSEIKQAVDKTVA
ncbi:bifunctional uridylate/adenylate kinase [Tilletia horrida]|uniref:Uridylate kinase n=1 Tax=Tilletia horrida TaxID=155126 RepID=A0AAN6JWL8_9BASI|nr:bifunctional uridylate/adenylate kinase [Tilletia horrida]KAK0556975.1 bifunctional uridylate/adenylate kinase [Tilletia horrida]KAK0566669.1 bifunctional uridylate/adenylate kinase [Tilletia horrida]